MTENKAMLHARKIAEDKRADADWNWRHGRLNSDDCIKCAEQHEQLADWIEELQQYRAIGTIEECRKARERQRTRKPERKIQGEDLKIGCITFKAGTKTYWCPSCKKPVTGSDSYCRWCGQSIDLYELK